MINNKIAGAIGVIFAAGASMSGAYAADGTIHATGDVTNSTCAVDVAGTSAQFGTIDLGSLKKTVVKNTSNLSGGAKLLGKEFYISFSNCSSANEQYTLKLSGSQTYYGTFISTGTGNAELRVYTKEDSGNYTVVSDRPAEIGPYAVGLNYRTHIMDVSLYRQYISTLTLGDIKYDIDYTVNFL
ncbi:hypothetical protein QCD58_004727 [Enterobacter hormaechei]|nr:hypothetical protein [Enterobacter hormaechei]